MSTESDHLLSRIPGSELLSLSERRKWEDIYAYFRKSGFSIFTYSGESENKNWIYTVDSQFYKAILSNYTGTPSSKTSNYHFANKELALVFSDDTIVQQEVWEKLKANFSLFILGIPNQEIKKYSFEELKNWILFQQQISQVFPQIEFLKALKINNVLRTKSLSKTALLLANNWIKIFTKLRSSSKAANHFYSSKIELPNLAVFKMFPPSIQALVVLIGQGLTHVLNLRDQTLVNRHLAVSNEAVFKFFEKNKAILISAFQNSNIDKNSSKSWPNEVLENDLAVFFTRLDQLDYNYYTLNSIHQYFNSPSAVLDSSNSDLLQFLRKALQNPNWIQAIRPSIITDKLIDIRVNKSVEKFPKFSKRWSSLLKPGYAQDWNLDINQDRLKRIFGSIATEHQALIQLNSESCKENDLLFILNKFSSPIFKFDKQENRIFPSWNLLSAGVGEKLISQLADWKSLRSENQEKVRDRLNQISHQYSRGTVQKNPSNIRTISSTQDSDFKQLFRQATHSQNVFGKYSIQRMKDFGLENERISETRKSIWLKELLSIEKEINPYIQFVKQSFQGALPVRKTVNLDPNRHATDGIEFAPETVRDARKWLEGNIFRTLKTTLKKGNAIQINVFALDASGSMSHEKMRNLYKILTLLINGLEDRKSYDAFHFFSHKFIEGAKFTDQYTSKNLLFQILKSIATIRNGEIIYGGDGGTNISEAIRICHERMLRFETKIRSKHKKSVFVKSIFVITDGEPSIGIINPTKLNKFINEKREKFNIEIKGIYLKPKLDLGKSFMEGIFGTDQFIETDEFNEAVNLFTQIISLTYKNQRKNLKSLKNRK